LCSFFSSGRSGSCCVVVVLVTGFACSSLMERAGVPRSVAMKVTRYKTEAIDRRYAIVAERDIAEGLAKVAALYRRVVGEGQLRDNRPVATPSRELVIPPQVC
jgi:hypothetical protein